MTTYLEIRSRELPKYGDWPWRYIVEGLKPGHYRKRWPWSRKLTVWVEPKWVQLPHALLRYEPCQAHDAQLLAAAYRTEQSQ
jgi:hypothetical protein